MATYRFRFTVLGRYPARVRGNKTAVTVTLAAGEGDAVVHAGTLTMSEDEWGAFLEGIRSSLGDAVEVDDPGAEEG